MKTCATAIGVTFGADGIATHSGTNQYGLDQYQGNCVAGANNGADVVYQFTAGLGQSLDVTINADFDALLYLTNSQCGNSGNKLTCQSTGSLSLSGLAGGTYWLYVDGAAEKEWGSYDLTIQLSTPGQ